MDRRQKKTREAIFRAFEQLLTQRSYSKITVQDIIDAADVGRTTFYAHFATKDTLLEALCNELFEHVFTICPERETKHDFSLSEGDSRTVVTHILYHLRENGMPLARLIVGESRDVFLIYFKKYLNELIVNNLLSGMDHKNKEVPVDFLQNHISGSFVNMVQWWIRGGMKEEPETMADYFFRVISPIL